METSPPATALLERGDNRIRVTATFSEVRQHLESWVGEYLRRWETITGQPATSSSSELSRALLLILRNVEQDQDWQGVLRRILQPYAAFWTKERCQFAESLWFEVLSDVSETRHWDGETWLAWDALLNDVRSVITTMTDSSTFPSSPQRDEAAMDPSLTQPIPVDDLIDHMQSALQSSTAREIPTQHSSLDAILPASGMRRPLSTESSPMPLDLQAPPASQTSSGQQAGPNFYGIVEHLPLPALFVDASGTLTFLNHRGHELLRTFEEETGVGPEQLLGQALSRFVEAIPGLQGLGSTKLQATGIRFALGDETYVIDWSTVTSEQRRVGTVYVIRNITAQTKEEARRREAEADQNAVTSLLTALQSASSATDAAMIALNLVRDGFGWAYGSYWVLDPKDKTLKFSAESGEVTSEFRRITESASFAHGVGLSGRTWKQRELVFVEDLSKVTDCVRAPAAQRAGVKSGVCFPIEVGGQVVATMDFFSLTTLTLSDSRRETLRSVGRLVSQTMDRLQETERQERLMREMSRIQNMMDNLPINVIMAGRDTKIAYMNPATIRTLKTIEHLLPVTVEQLQGQSFDILHKAPEMQRRIVSDPKNLPHRARIKLGPETLDLLVTAISDNRGEYLGPMVTWSVITGQVKMADDFERDVKGVVEIVTSSATELQASSRNLAAASDETARQSQVVAAASEEATRNVETVSSAAEQLSKSIAEIARHVQEASKMTSSAVTEADRTNVTIKQLGDSSNEIGQVVKVITSIAQQTNLLALNATIEAARAGEAGKGFAVVANEVKELARQTAKATEEISQKILAIQGATGIAVTAIGSISDSIRKINEISTTIASAVEEQTAATNEISRNVAEAARGTAEVSSNIAGVSQASDEGGRGASDILVAAEGLARESVRLESVTSSFLDRMRKL